MIQQRYNAAIIASAIVFVLGALLALVLPGAGVTMAALGIAFGVFETLNINLALIREAKAEGLKVRIVTWAFQYFGCVALAVAAWGALAWRVMA